MAWLGLIDAVKATVRNFRRPVHTVRYPEVQRERAERYRAPSFALLHDEKGEELCFACLLCEKICPSQVITIKASPKKESPITGKKRQYADDFTLDLSACLQCELCVQVCGADAIQMVRQPEAPSYSREGLFLTMKKLYENEQLPKAWANGSHLQGMQEPPKKPAPVTAAVAATAPAVSPATAVAKTVAVAAPGAAGEIPNPTSQPRSEAAPGPGIAQPTKAAKEVLS